MMTAWEINMMTAFRNKHDDSMGNLYGEFWGTKLKDVL
jgi:hypothetical protein